MTSSSAPQYFRRNNASVIARNLLKRGRQPPPWDLHAAARKRTAGRVRASLSEQPRRGIHLQGKERRYAQVCVANVNAFTQDLPPLSFFSPRWFSASSKHVPM